MLHGGSDDVASRPAVLVEGGPEGPVVGFRTAGGEIELFGLTAQGVCYCLAAPVHQVTGRAAQGVLGGGIAEVLRQDPGHLLGHRPGHRGGGGMV